MSAASISVPRVAHPAAELAGLDAKVTVRGLDFYYGETRALKELRQTAPELSFYLIS